ncbi:MAG: hypothetical protein R3B99_25405 [Polyangiales bacterium]
MRATWFSSAMALWASVVVACGSDDDFVPRPIDASPDASTDAGSPPREVRVVRGDVVAEVDARFLSFAVDTAQLVGGTFWSNEGGMGATGDMPVPPFDFERPRLRALAGALSPALLRLGGSDADKVFYDLSETPVAEAPAPYRWVLTAGQLDGALAMAEATGLDVLFTMNLGPGPRDAEGAWTDAQARRLLEHVRDSGRRIDVFELGNEPNAFRVIHGLDFVVPPEQLVADHARFAATLREVLGEDTRLAGPGSAFWPVVGELAPVFPDFLAAGGGAHLDVITWHYYPQQSRRCPLATRRARETTMLDSEHLDEVTRWASEVEAAAARHAPGAEVWLGESGHAQCGGEPGLSDRFVSTFWWLDQLGLLARRGQRVVVRQALAGADYGLLHPETLTPRPDFWASWMFKRLMGTQVLDARSDDANLRAYAHCRREVPGEAVMLLLNLAPRDADVRVDGAREVFLVEAELLGQELRLDGRVLADVDGALPELRGREATDAIAVPGRAWAFVTTSEPACR